jgi:hypothetical protein
MRQELESEDKDEEDMVRIEGVMMGGGLGLGNHFSNVLYIVTLCILCKYTRALTFQNFCKALASSSHPFASRCSCVALCSLAWASVVLWRGSLAGARRLEAGAPTPGAMMVLPRDLVAQVPLCFDARIVCVCVCVCVGGGGGGGGGLCCGSLCVHSLHR